MHHSSRRASTFDAHLPGSYISRSINSFAPLCGLEQRALCGLYRHPAKTISSFQELSCDLAAGGRAPEIPHEYGGHELHGSNTDLVSVGQSIQVGRCLHAPLSTLRNFCKVALLKACPALLVKVPSLSQRTGSCRGKLTDNCLHSKDA